MKVVSAKSLSNLIGAMEMVEADEMFAASFAEHPSEQYDHLNTMAVYKAIREKLEKIPVFEV